jgi:hypothetical protein
MRYLKTFENFDGFDLGRFSEEDNELDNNFYGDEMEAGEEECEPCGSDDYSEEDEYTFSSEEDDEEFDEVPTRIKRWGDEDSNAIGSLDEKKKEKGTSYKKSGLKHPEKADLNKDKKISPYEKARGKAVQKSMQGEKEERDSKEKGLTTAQKKLPEGLRKAIEAKNKKK